MHQALEVLDDGGAITDHRLTCDDLGFALCKVHVTDPAEHRLLFDWIHDPADRQGRVSIGELGSAIATVAAMLTRKSSTGRLYIAWVSARRRRQRRSGRS